VQATPGAVGDFANVRRDDRRHDGQRASDGSAGGATVAHRNGSGVAKRRLARCAEKHCSQREREGGNDGSLHLELNGPGIGDLEEGLYNRKELLRCFPERHVPGGGNNDNAGVGNDIGIVGDVRQR
jgi:hypothetical protein